MVKMCYLRKILEYLKPISISMSFYLISRTQNEIRLKFSANISVKQASEKLGCYHIKTNFGNLLVFKIVFYILLQTCFILAVVTAIIVYSLANVYIEITRHSVISANIACLAIIKCS